MIKNLILRYRCLKETWQRGYSWSYRWFRFREAFGLPLPPTVVWVRKEDKY